MDSSGQKKSGWFEWDMVPVPNNMTNHFQTIGVTVNRSGKAHLSKSTQNWVTSEVQNNLKVENNRRTSIQRYQAPVTKQQADSHKIGRFFHH